MSSTQKKSMRTWLSPITGISFLTIGVTGLLMFFHLDFPGMTTLHELGGVLFVIAGILHLKTNWRPLMSCCRQRSGRIALCVGAAIMAVILVLGLGHEEFHRRHGEGSPSPARVHRH